MRRARADCRQRDQWYASMHLAWDAQLPSFVDAYLLWKHRHATALEETQQQVGRVFHVTHVGVFGMFCFRVAY